MIDVIYWPDGTWCLPEELSDYQHMSDDYTKIKVPEFWDAGMIDDHVFSLVSDY